MPKKVNVFLEIFKDYSAVRVNRGTLMLINDLAD